MTATKSFEATKDETFNIVLEKTIYTITCSIDDGTDPVQGAVVTFTDSTDSTIKFTSGASGSAGGCTVKPVAGTYVVTAECEGYEDYTGTKTSDNTHTSFTIQLTAVTEDDDS